ncbi:efflux RND transporter periplasmic adaptor subunit [Stenotrophomonas sp. HITSZ_GD]|uniref:efflux RND transporter periplasmic adaptor subunit n=1 Tax=Stenotrophomonas sp. HITSZ_GD TaxID=3037248 RepID=UPI00240E071A|nr:efflux RND transporter periplasmic adaptor subunit [Stenotrophomonas sp. HITSZ_GD]MDG2524126.1 efflux RND transporter periplasmic adaptor subunit [Stenotrophomonas sp. HITSZ_GD]
MNPVFLLRLTLLLLLAPALAACGGKPAPADAAPTTPAGQPAPGPHADDTQGEDVESTTIPARIAEESGIRVAPAGEGRIIRDLEVQGLIAPVDGSAGAATARFPGQVRSLRAHVGDRVRAGQVLATVESNLSLTTYAVTAPLSGQVLARQVPAGAGVAEGQSLFEIADLSRVWVDLHAFGGDMRHLQPGAVVTVTRLYDGVTREVRLDRVLPGADTASQSAVARAVLDNDDGLWRPGAAVTARIRIDDRAVPVQVPLTALQTMDGRDVVLVREGERYHAQPVRLGERDTHNVEVLEGLRAGQEVVVEQSYLVKADIEKAGASHAH